MRRLGDEPRSHQIRRFRFAHTKALGGRVRRNVYDEEFGIAFATSLHHLAEVGRDLAGANFAIARRGACGGVVRGSQN